MTTTLLLRHPCYVVVDKPSGLAVHRGWARDDDVLCDRLAAELARPVFLAHRLDRATSGALLVALDAETARFFGRAFEEGRVRKTYVALVRGAPPASVVIDHPIRSGEEKDSPRVPAQTRVRRLASFGRYALVEAEPLTGRLHQIRRHLKHIACPIIGDVNYGKGEHNRIFRERYGLHRLFLHATALAFPEPSTGDRVEVASPLPLELRTVIDGLRALESTGAARNI